VTAGPSRSEAAPLDEPAPLDRPAPLDPAAPLDPRARLDPVIRAALEERELTFERSGPGSYVVTLEGTHKLATTVLLAVGDHALTVQSFVVRRPDENHEAFYRFLLERNARMYGVAFSLDALGDVYLSGRLSLASVTAEEIDRLLGCVLDYADSNFDAALELGFASSIRREWAWRAERGESVANLAAFARFADPDRG